MSKRTNERLRLTVNSHTDCIILMNAVREHCERTSSEYQAAFLLAKQEGDEPKAQQMLRWRDDAERCRVRMLGRLELMRRKFESRMDGPPEGAGAGGGDGYPVDNATCIN